MKLKHVHDRSDYLRSWLEEKSNHDLDLFMEGLGKQLIAKAHGMLMPTADVQDVLKQKTDGQGVTPESIKNLIKQSNSLPEHLFAKSAREWWITLGKSFGLSEPQVAQLIRQVYQNSQNWLSGGQTAAQSQSSAATTPKPTASKPPNPDLIKLIKQYLKNHGLDISQLKAEDVVSIGALLTEHPELDRSLVLFEAGFANKLRSFASNALDMATNPAQRQLLGPKADLKANNLRIAKLAVKMAADMARSQAGQPTTQPPGQTIATPTASGPETDIQEYPRAETSKELGHNKEAEVKYGDRAVALQREIDELSRRLHHYNAMTADNDRVNDIVKFCRLLWDANESNVHINMANQKANVLRIARAYNRSMSKGTAEDEAEKAFRFLDNIKTINDQLKTRIAQAKAPIAGKPGKLPYEKEEQEFEFPPEEKEYKLQPEPIK